MARQAHNLIYTRADSALTRDIDDLNAKIAKINHFLASSIPAPSASLAKTRTFLSKRQRLIYA